MRAIVPISNLSRRVPEAGRIRIGEKVKGRGKERPGALAQFRFTSHDREALDQISSMYGGTVRPWSDPKAAEGQFEVYTEAPEIRIVLPPDPLGDTPIYELWGGGGCERRCDGLTATILQQGADGLEPVETQCLCQAKGEMACKVTTRLNVILPEVRFAGVWRLDTKSWNAAQELPGMVELIQQMQGQGLSYATLGIKNRRSVQAGETHKFMVPVLGVGASIEQLAAGHARLASIDTPSRAVAELEAVSDARHQEAPSEVDQDRSAATLGSSPEGAADDASAVHLDTGISDAEIVDDLASIDSLRTLMVAAGLNEARVLVIARRLAPSVGVAAPTSFDKISGHLLAAVCDELGGPFDDGPGSGGQEASGPDGPEVVPDDDVELVDEDEEQAAVVGGGASIDRQEVGASAPTTAAGKVPPAGELVKRAYFARAAGVAADVCVDPDDLRARLALIVSAGNTTSASGFTTRDWGSMNELLDRLIDGWQLIEDGDRWRVERPGRGAAA